MPKPSQVSLTVTRDAAQELREVRVLMARDAPRVPTLSQVIRALAATWRDTRRGDRT